MTTVRFYRTRPLADGTSAPIGGTLRFTPTRKRVVEHVEGPAETILPIGFTAQVPSDTGRLDVDLAPTEPGWVWEIYSYGFGVTSTFEYVIVPDQNEPIDEDKLVRVSKDTLDPEREPDPAWWAELESAKALGSQVEQAKTHAVVAASDAGSARDQAQSAQQAAQQSAQAAQQSAIGLDDAATVANDAKAIAVESADEAKASAVASAASANTAQNAATGATGSASHAVAIAQSVRDDADAGLFKGEPGKDGSNVLPTNTAIAQAVNSPGTAAHNAIHSLIDSATSGSDAVQPFLSIVENQTRDAHMLLLGDSTGNETWEWAYLFFQDLASRYPSHAFEYRLWNETTQAYDPPVTLGTGTRKVTMWNASVPGAHTQYWLGDRFTPAIKAVPADLIMISLGHNEGSGTSYSWAWRARYLALTETLSLSKPASTIVLVGQNPATANDWQARRVDIYKGIAARQGYGFIDAHAAFIRAGGNLTLDGIHPNPEGARLWADVMLSAFTRTKAEPRIQVRSLLARKAVENAMPNGGLGEWSGATPKGWTLAGATVTKDTTGQETGSAAATITSTGANGGIYVNLPSSQVKGRRYMLAVRAKVPAGATTMAGRIGFYDNVNGSRLQSAGSPPTDGYRWILHEGDFAPEAATTRVYIYAGDAGSSVTIDRIILTEGIEPTDAIEVSAAASEGGGSGEPAIPWGTPTGLEHANGATSTRLEIRRVGNLVHLFISGLILPESASNRIIVKVPAGYRSTAGLPTTTSTIIQLTGTGDSNPKNLQLMAVSGANVSWNGAVDSTTWSKIAQPARVDALLTWYTDDAMPV